MLAKQFGLSFIALAIFLADRFLKLYFIKNPTINLGGDFFYGLLTFGFAKNTGIAFGVAVNQFFLIILIVLVLFYLTGMLCKFYLDKRLIVAFGLILIIVGAFSNLLDRLKYGFVIDYIDLKWFTIFNLADTAITLGVAILALNLFIFNRPSQNQKINVS